MRGVFALVLLSACASAPEAPPADPTRNLVEQARLSAGRGDRDAAFAGFARAIEADPACAAAYYHRGVLREAELNLQGALTDYEQFLRLAPDDARADEVRRSAEVLRAITPRGP